MPIPHPTESALGVDLEGGNFAALSLKKEGIQIDAVKPLDTEELHLWSRSHQVVSGFDETLLIRPLHLPIVKEGALTSSLPLQLESILPYPIEESVIEKIILQQNNQETFLNSLTVKKEAVQSHLEACKAYAIDPEAVSTLPLALAHFTHFVKREDKPLFTLHLGKKITLVASQGELLLASFTTHDPKEIKKGLLAIKKKYPYPFSEQIFTIGTPQGEGFSDLALEVYENGKLAPYAVAVGYALSALPNKASVDFLKGDLSFKKPFKRLKKTIALYFISLSALSLAAYIFGQSYLAYREDELKTRLAEALYQKVDEEQDIAALSLDEVEQKIHEWQKRIQNTPNLFALHPNIPRVSDLIGWLAHHPIAGQMELLQIHYSVVKRPELTRKEDKYQTKVELEFTTETPRLAREFHDALIAPNEMVDPKGEIKWSTSKGAYKTSFYLKDKTFYP